LAVSCGKKVEFSTEGEETELDRGLLEAIKGPMTHLLRNAVDHGIEDPSERRAQGKPETGSLKLRAFHEGGQVIIVIVDDGGGINVSRVRSLAVERGLITKAQAHKLSDQDVSQLIFLPGFSTKAKDVSNLSGRGVGMDVVRSNIEKIGGSVALESVRGVGTTISVRIPLTLAIMPSLMVWSGATRFAIPQANLVELVHVPAAKVASAIEMVQDTPVYRLRGRLLPVVTLGSELKLGDARVPSSMSGIELVILSSDDRTFALVVDDVGDTIEIVVKPLGRELHGLSIYAGATIMGDGGVSLILDINGLARRAGVMSGSILVQDLEDTRDTSEALDENAESLLVLRVGMDRRVAMPVASVVRLLEAPESAVEFSGKREVLQVEGAIVPLLRLADALEVPDAESRDTLSVVLCRQAGRLVGLVATHVHDIVSTVVQVDRVSPRRGIVGSVVVEGRVTLLLDVPDLLRAEGISLVEAQAEEEGIA